MPNIQRGRKSTRDNILGRRRNTDRDTTHPPAKKTTQAQTQDQRPPQQNNTFTITKCVFNVKLFPDDKKPNRRMTAKEYAEELQDAKIWHRVPRDYIFDHPTYPWVPQIPKYTVNFDLNAPQ
ncbi:MAG: hypothetical protein [Anelloviridae sp.]|nr:MAG: hypothetical protein [Anelloviridae sp.]